MDLPSWEADLSADLTVITALLACMNKVTPEDDAKLQHLQDLIQKKIVAPLNADNKKVLIFTADTANYLYDNLAPLLRARGCTPTGKVTGKDAPKSTLKKSHDFQSILTLFSPVSKKRHWRCLMGLIEIGYLSGRTVFLKNKNLQDCDYLINYDIHWNPVRIIQRFGRIDRIGSRNNHIQLVNYWPDISLDEYINLKERVETRMMIADVTATGDDNMLTAQSSEVSYRRATPPPSG